MVSTVHRHHKFTFHHCFHSFVQFLHEKKNCCNRQPTICKCCFLFVNSIAVGFFYNQNMLAFVQSEIWFLNFLCCFCSFFCFSKYAVKFWILQSYNHNHKCVRSRIDCTWTFCHTRCLCRSQQFIVYRVIFPSRLHLFASDINKKYTIGYLFWTVEFGANMKTLKILSMFDMVVPDAIPFKANHSFHGQSPTCIFHMHLCSIAIDKKNNFWFEI